MSVLELKNSVFLLPSRGIPYDENSGVSLLEDGYVKIRHFLASDQKTFGSGGGDISKVYRELLSKVVTEPKDLKHENLLLSDITAILFAVRVMSYGPKYTMSFKCPSCGANSKSELDIGDLEVWYPEDLSDGTISMYNTIKLPNCGSEIELKLPTLGDERATDDLMRAAKRRGSSDISKVARVFKKLSVLIKKVDGKEMVASSAASEFLDNLSMSDFDFIQESLTDLDTGVRGTVPVTCSECGDYIDVPMNIDAEFLRPKRGR